MTHICFWGIILSFINNLLTPLSLAACKKQKIIAPGHFRFKKKKSLVTIAPVIVLRRTTHLVRVKPVVCSCCCVDKFACSCSHIDSVPRAVNGFREWCD